MRNAHSIKLQASGASYRLRGPKGNKSIMRHDVNDVDQEEFADCRRKPRDARAGASTACEVTLCRDRPLGSIKIGATRTAANNAKRQ
jgi:hypothetical protein